MSSARNFRIKSKPKAAHKEKLVSFEHIDAIGAKTATSQFRDYSEEGGSAGERFLEELCPAYFLLLDNMALMKEREKMEAENNIPPSKTSVDYVRDNVIARRIQKLFIKTIQDLGRDELEEFERVFMIVDKDLDLGREHHAKKGPVDSEERKWENRVAGRPGADVDTDSLLAFLDDSNLLMRSQIVKIFQDTKPRDRSDKKRKASKFKGMHARFMDLRVNYLYPETEQDQTKRNLRDSRDSLRRQSRDQSPREADMTQREPRPVRRATGLSSEEEPLEAPEIPRKPDSPKPPTPALKPNPEQPKIAQPIARDNPDDKGRTLKKADSSQIEPTKPMKETTQLADSKRQLFIVEGFNLMDESHIVRGEDNVVDICTEYFKELSRDTSSSMMCDWKEIKQSLEKSDKDLFVTFRAKNGADAKKTKGMAIIAISDDKANILHLSTLRTDDFEAAGRLVLRYVTGNSKIKEAIIALKHYSQQEQGEAKLKISDHYKQKLKDLGFKWRAMHNNQSGARCTSFYFRPAATETADQSEPYLRLNTGQLLAVTVSVQHVLLYSDRPIAAQGFATDNQVVDSSLGELFVLRRLNPNLQKEHFEEYLDRVLKKPHKQLDLQALDGLDFKPFPSRDQKAVSKVAANFISSGTPSITVDPASSLDLGFCLSHGSHLKHARGGRHSIEGVAFEYVRVQITASVAVMDSANGMRLFLVPTHESGQQLLFFIQLRAPLTGASRTDPGLFRELVGGALKNSKMTEEKLIDKDLWIPNFRAQSVVSNSLHGLLKDPATHHLVSLVSFDLEADSREDLIQRQAGEDSIVIAEEFIVGLLDSSVEEKLGLCVLAMLVSPHNFVPA